MFGALKKPLDNDKELLKGDLLTWKLELEIVKSRNECLT